MSLTSHISECVLNRACERPPLLDGCALLLKVSRYRAHASRGLARAPPAVCAASEASRHFLTGAATPPLGGGECPARTTLLWFTTYRSLPLHSREFINLEAIVPKGRISTAAPSSAAA